MRLPQLAFGEHQDLNFGFLSLKQCQQAAAP